MMAGRRGGRDFFVGLFRKECEVEDKTEVSGASCSVYR